MSLLLNDITFGGNSVTLFEGLSANTSALEDEQVTFPFTVRDQEGSPTLSARSLNTALVPESGSSVSGTGGSHAVTITPAPNQAGVVDVELSATQGDRARLYSHRAS